MHPATEKLLHSNPFDPANAQLFVDSFRENVKALWDEAKCHPSQLKTEEDLKSSPYIMVNAFKENVFRTCKEEDVKLHLTSSGTGGMKSHQFLDEESFENVKQNAWMVHEALGLVNEDKRYNYFCFTYDPKVANDLGTAFTDELLTSFTPKNEVYYAFQWSEAKGDFEFNKSASVAKLKEFEGSGLPTRILGFPAFLKQLIDEFDVNLSLGPDAWVQTGGGWKGLADQEIPKNDFRTKVAKRLGLPKENIRDMFGMVEHGIPYIDCEEGHLHIPNYARVYVRDPFTLEVLPPGRVGLVQFLCSYNFSYPAFNFLATDYAKIENCRCKRGGPILVIQGRAGVTKHKGCAIKALDLLKTEEKK
mgnify:CR=1 FL=1